MYHERKAWHHSLRTKYTTRVGEEESFFRTIMTELSGGLFSIASDDFDFGLADLLAHFSEFRRIHDESPHVVAEAVRVQVSFEGEFGANAIGQCVIDGFVELQ